MVLHYQQYLDRAASITVEATHVYALLVIISIFCLSTGIYRLYFHPLANIPGPKLAALTDSWSYYYELRGHFPWKVKKLESTYGWGPVIRVGPNRVVIHDPKQYDVIYRVGSQFLKDASYYAHFPSASGGGTTTTAVDRKWHAARRRATVGKLSRQKVGDLHPLVAEKLSLLMHRVEEVTKAGKPINVFSAWRSMTLDIITKFAFGTCLNSLDDSNLHHPMLDVVEMAVAGFYNFLRLPLLLSIAQNRTLSPMFPGSAELAQFKQWTRSCVLGYKPDPNTSYLFDTLMDENAKPPLTVDQIQTEAEDIMIAGHDTTATTLTYASVHLSRAPELWEQLYQDISPVYQDVDTVPPSQVLERVPLLTACIKESLRLAAPVPAYLWRIVPTAGYQFESANKSFYLPPGTSVGMSAAIQHFDESLFPESDKFIPSRWLGPNNTCNGPKGDLDQYLVPFSKGTRQCGGINLAWMEIYMALATMVMKFKIKGEIVPGKPLNQLEAFVGILQDNKYEIAYQLRQA